MEIAEIICAPPSRAQAKARFALGRAALSDEWRRRKKKAPLGVWRARFAEGLRRRFRCVYGNDSVRAPYPRRWVSAFRLAAQSALRNKVRRSTVPRCRRVSLVERVVRQSANRASERRAETRSAEAFPPMRSPKPRPRHYSAAVLCVCVFIHASRKPVALFQTP